MALDPKELAARKCVPCDGNVRALSPDQVQEYLPAVPHWVLTPDGKSIARAWRVKDFTTAIDFFQRIADIAESLDHHPDLCLNGYRNVMVEIWTHAAGGLTENDFILAACIDQLPVELKK